MDINGKKKLREILKSILKEHDDLNEFTDSESLFVGGRLDSFSMMTLVMHLEEEFGVRFDAVDFSVDLIDSVDRIESFLDSKSAG